MGNLTETQINFRKEMSEIDEEYQNKHKKDNGFIIALIIYIFICIMTYLFFPNNEVKETESNNSFIKDREYIFNYLSEYDSDEIIITYNQIIKRFKNNEDYNLIKNDISNELVYINSFYDKLNQFNPKENIKYLHNLNLEQIKQIKILYEIITNSNESNFEINEASILYCSKFKTYFDEMINVIKKCNFEYTIHNDGSVTYEYKKLTY